MSSSSCNSSKGASEYAAAAGTVGNCNGNVCVGPNPSCVKQTSPYYVKNLLLQDPYNCLSTDASWLTQLQTAIINYQIPLASSVCLGNHGATSYVFTNPYNNTPSISTTCPGNNAHLGSLKHYKTYAGIYFERNFLWYLQDLFPGCLSGGVAIQNSLTCDGTATPSGVFPCSTGENNLCPTSNPTCSDSLVCGNQNPCTLPLEKCTVASQWFSYSAKQVPTVSSGSTEVCVDTQTDSFNCGSCGHSCNPYAAIGAQICIAGTCMDQVICGNAYCPSNAPICNSSGVCTTN